MPTVLFSLVVAMMLGATDPKDDLIAASVDLRNLAVTQHADMVRVEITTTEPSNFETLLLFIDADSNAATGYAPPDRPNAGFDMLVQGTQLFRHTGEDRAAWNWNPIATIERTAKDATLSLRIGIHLIKENKIKLAAWTMSNDWQTVLDMVPDAGALPLTINPDYTPTERKGDADKPDHDITAVTLTEADKQLTLRVTAAAESTFETALIFLDADGKHDTGYRSPARPHMGFELLLQGDALYRHNGDKPDVWSWQRIGDANRHVEAQTLSLTIPASTLGPQRVSAMVCLMSSNWQDMLDVAPDAGAYRVKLTTPRAAEPKPAAMAPPRPRHNLPLRQRTAQAESFYCYYGGGETERLSHYDLVVLEERAQQRSDIERLKRNGVVTVAYITVGEDARLRQNKSWYFDRDNDGQPDMNTIWRSYYANAADPTWRADRLDEASRLIDDEGYDGIFLDTLDTVVHYPDSFTGMVELVRAFRSRFPDKVIVLNQGLSLLPHIAPAADAVMLESFTLTYDFQTRRYLVNELLSLDQSLLRIRRALLPVLTEHPLKVLVLDYCRRDDTDAIQLGADRAATFGFLFATAPIQLDAVHPHPPVGRPDQRWTQRQVTPEMLRHTLTAPANGFPAQTVIEPSSCFGRYSVAAIVDGVADRTTLHWSKAAWASAEMEDDHRVELRFPEPIHSGTLRITWALDNGKHYPSRQYTIEVSPDNNTWQTVTTITDNHQPVVTHPLPAEPFKFLRITQPRAGGSPHRPLLMWIAQLERIEP